MVERLKTVAETMWEDEKNFLEVLSILGVRKFLTTLRTPAETDTGAATVQPGYNETIRLAA